MEIWEILLIGAALSMDAFAVGMTNGMTEPEMGKGKMLLIAFSFGLFQFIMPVVGYYGGYAFSASVAKIAPYLSFAILALIGGKAIADSLLAERKKAPPLVVREKLGPGKLAVQAVATSLDALAVGITFLAADAGSALPAHPVVCALIIGIVTFCFVLPAVRIGKVAGNKISRNAEILGGIMLVAIGVKLLLEGII